MIEERLLNALLHLFAMQAAVLPEPARDPARRRVLAYLNHHVGLANAETYLGLFDELRELREGDSEAALLEQAAALAARLEPLLHGFERHAAVLRFLELAALAPASALPRRLALLIGETLDMTADRLVSILAFIADPQAQAAAAGDTCRLLGGGPGDSFRGRLAALRLDAEAPLLVAPVGDETIRLEGVALSRGDCHLLRPGHVLRDPWGNELHVAQIAAAFAGQASAGPRIVLSGERLEFRFPGSDKGLRDFSFQERDGRLIAIMGGSGAGKSTLLSILNGTLAPDSGQLRLNGRDVHADPDAAQGVFGFIPQDDLLFEDLTVFENLFYAARLCMANRSDDELRQRVNDLLSDLGQAETAHLKVGSPLRKVVSGGQRKRLNIALELIREPTVLFVDEPTSGLSSADSEMVMSLLRQQAANGKLIFVVIHQPSSKILRMFDALWVLDQGGWPIFRGSPLEAVAYFRSRGDLPGAEEAICSGCGSVSPEQIFEIVEGRLLDRGGRPTQERRVDPPTWHRLFREYEAARETPPLPETGLPVPATALVRPGRLGQLGIFFMRDLRARLANRTYLAINLLEPPLLALVLGLVARGAFGGTYSFHENDNILVFFFMSIIVALFLGLSVSAEEICRDRRIQQRERFLNLSWWSYINSKALYLALVAGIQMSLYLLVALPLVKLPGFGLELWAMLFACAFAASMLGLIVSATLRSAVTIYILIPLLLVPQMLLSGVIVRYDDLIVPDSRDRHVPGYANLLPSRWAYEALVVEQYSHNEAMRPLLAADARVRLAEQDLDAYLPDLQGRVQSILLLRDQAAPAERIQTQLTVLEHEFGRLAKGFGPPAGLDPDAFEPDRYDRSVQRQLETYLGEVRQTVFAERRAASAERRAIEDRMTRELGAAGLDRLRKTHTNQAIVRQALNLQEPEPVGEARDGLYLRTLPIYRVPESPWGASHFLAGQKRLGETLVPTYPFNLSVIFVLTFLFYLVLGFRFLSRVGALATALVRRGPLKFAA